MRGRQGEIYRGGWAKSRAIMPYNSDATRTTISDSSVGRHPASQPHQKSLQAYVHNMATSALERKMDRFFRNAHVSSYGFVDARPQGGSRRKTSHLSVQPLVALKSAAFFHGGT